MRWSSLQCFLILKKAYWLQTDKDYRKTPVSSSSLGRTIRERYQQQFNALVGKRILFLSLPRRTKAFEENPVKDFSSPDFSTLYTNCAQLKHSNGNLWDCIKLQAMSTPCAGGTFFFFFFESSNSRLLSRSECFDRKHGLGKVKGMVHTLWLEL